MAVINGVKYIINIIYQSVFQNLKISYSHIVDIMAKESKTAKTKKTEEVVPDAPEVPEKKTKKSKKDVTEDVDAEGEVEVTPEKKSKKESKKASKKEETATTEVTKKSKKLTSEGDANEKSKKSTDDEEEKPKKSPKKAKTTETKFKKSAKKAQKGGDGDGEEEHTGKKTRSFKAIYINTDGDVVMEGRYCGAKPKQAACKALTGIYKIFNKEEKKIKGEIYFGVKETTRKGRGKFYWYNGERVKLENPITLKIDNGKKITYNFNNVVKKASEDECKHLLNYKCVEKEDEDVEHDEQPQQKAGAKQVKEVKAKPKQKEASSPAKKSVKKVAGKKKD